MFFTLPCSFKGTPASASQMAKDICTFLRWSTGVCCVNFACCKEVLFLMNG